MHNHVNTKGIVVSNELDMIQEAKDNTLFDFLSGLPYAVEGIVLVRKAGPGLVIEADPYGWIGVAMTPLDDHLQLLGLLCASYEAVVGTRDHSFAGVVSHLSASNQAIEAYRLRHYLDQLDVKWSSNGDFDARMELADYETAGFKTITTEDGEVSAQTPVGVYCLTRTGQTCILDLWL